MKITLENTLDLTLEVTKTIWSLELSIRKTKPSNATVSKLEEFVRMKKQMVMGLAILKGTILAQDSTSTSPKVTLYCTTNTSKTT